MKPRDCATTSTGRPVDFCDARIKILRRVALQRRSGQRGEIIGQREMLGLRQRLLAERAFALELGRRERRQLQRGAEREAVAAELECALEHRRHHQDAGNHDALIVLQRARDLGGAKAAIAFAEDEFRRSWRGCFWRHRAR